MTEKLPLVVLIGEVNPYSRDPRYALYDQPAHATGGRLRWILGLPRVFYLGFDADRSIERRDLCTGSWSMTEAERQAVKVLEMRAASVLVLLGRKVAAAFELSDAPAFGVARVRARTTCMLLPHPSANTTCVLLPHPSGRNPAWREPGAVERARALLREVCPEIPWGSDTG